MQRSFKIYEYHQIIDLRNYQKIERDNTVFALMINGVFVLNGVEGMLMVLK